MGIATGRKQMGLKGLDELSPGAEVLLDTAPIA
jgi:hypothetical protein